MVVAGENVTSDTIPASATTSLAAPRLTTDTGRLTSVWLEARMLWIILLIIVIAVVLYMQRERLSNMRR